MSQHFWIILLCIEITAVDTKSDQPYFSRGLICLNYWYEWKFNKRMCLLKLTWSDQLVELQKTSHCWNCWNYWNTQLTNKWSLTQMIQMLACRQHFTLTTDKFIVVPFLTLPQNYYYYLLTQSRVPNSFSYSHILNFYSTIGCGKGW